MVGFVDKVGIMSTVLVARRYLDFARLSASLCRLTVLSAV
jgi:hypothetical protein